MIEREKSIAAGRWRCLVSYEKVYRFVNKKQLDQIFADKAIKPTFRRDIIEEKAVFVTPIKGVIHETIQPYDYQGEEGYILTIDGRGLEFFNEGYDSSVDEENKILSCRELGWYTTEDILIESILDIEFLPKVKPELNDKKI